MTKSEIKKDIAAEVAAATIGIRLHRSHIGRTATFNRRQKEDAGKAVGADADMTRGGTRLYDPKDPYIKAINTTSNAIYRHWINHTIWFPLDGVRLLKRDLLEKYDADFDDLLFDFREACRDADNHRDEILAAAKAKLHYADSNGDERSAFDPGNYPTSYVDSYSISWSTHNYAVDPSLMELAPETFARERERVAATLEATAARFADESREMLATLVNDMVAKLDPADGSKPVFRESAATNLREFFERFRMVNISSDAQLEALIDQASDALGDTSMKSLKASPSKRRETADAMKTIQSKLDDMIRERPERSINIDDLED